MWSPTKFDFSFYDFFVIYYDFLNIQYYSKTMVTVVNRCPKLLQEVKYMVLESSRGKLDRFIVWGLSRPPPIVGG
jgi:hypothetical protein